MTAQHISADDETYVSAPYIADGVLEEREYQSALVEAASNQSTLLALPTGLGKTPVAARVAARRLATVGGMVLMLAPTQPLVQQHTAALRTWLSLDADAIQPFTGDLTPDERAATWHDTRIVVATPQCLENDLIGNRYTLENVSLCVFDECHRASGDYPYTYIGERYNGNATNPLVLGLSASPGSDEDSILTVATNLGLTNVEVLTEEDDALADHLHDVTVDHRWIELPDAIRAARDCFEELYTDVLEQLKCEYGVLESRAKDIPFQELMAAKGRIQEQIDAGAEGAYEAISAHARALKLYHAISTVESQGVEAALSFLEDIKADAAAEDSQAAEQLVASPTFQSAIDHLESFDDIHPKLQELRVETVRTLVEDGQVLIFTESRETARTIVEFLDQHSNINPVRFVGQADKDGDPGMSQQEQQAALEAFADGEYNVLVATRVAEEGIDIPSVDLVLFYEPVASGIRSIQRQGRTGRRDDGRVVVLIGEDTRDEGRFWAAKKRKERMHSELKAMKDLEESLSTQLHREREALAAAGDRPTGEDLPVVVADTRETRSAVTRALDRHPGVETTLETLAVGDYLLSERAAVERKTHDDFIESLTGDRNFFEQAQALVEAYQQPFLFLEGDGGVEALYGRAQVDAAALTGALAALAMDFGLTIIPTESEDQTATLLAAMAQRAQTSSDRPVQRHQEKPTSDLTDQQEYVVASIAKVGTVTARHLLDHFDRPVDVFTASKDELLAVDKVGEATADQILRVLRSEY